MTALAARPVVAGIDARPSAQHTLRWAAHAAANRNVPLKIVYAPRFLGSEAGFDDYSPGAKRTAAKILGEAQALAHSLTPGVEVGTEFAHTGAAWALIGESAHAGLLVVGSHGHTRCHDLLLGSTSLRAAMRAHCTVAVIPASYRHSIDGGIVVGVDAMPYTQAAIACAFAEAHRTHTALTAVHAAARAPHDEQNEASRLMEAALQSWRTRYPDVGVRTVVANAPPAAALAQFAHGASQLIVGSRNLGAVRGLLHGSAGHALLTRQPAH